MLPVAIFTFLYPAFGAIAVPMLILANYHNKFTNQMKWLFVSSTFVIAALGYSMGEWGDLERYHQQLLWMGILDLPTVFQFDEDNLYVADTLLYFVSQTGNMQVLNYIIGLIDYGIVFYVLLDRINRSPESFTVGQVLKLVVIIIGIVPFFNIIANVRCVTAYIIILFAAYRDLVQKKRNVLTYLLYVLPIGLHVSAIIILLLRFIQIAAKRFGRSIILVAIFMPALIDFFYEYSSIFSGNLIGDFVANAISRAYAYLYWTDTGFAAEVQDNVTDKLTRIYGTFFIGYLTLLLIFAKKKSIQILHRDIFLEPMIAYIYVMGACTLGCLYIVTGAFWRFEAAVVLFSPIILISLLEMKDKFINIWLDLLFFSGFFMLAMNFIYLCRNMDVASMGKSFVLTTGVEVLYYVLNGILSIFA